MFHRFHCPGKFAGAGNLLIIFMNSESLKKINVNVMRIKIEILRVA